MQTLTLRETARRYRCSPGYLSERVREGKPVKGNPLHENAVIEDGRVKEFRFPDSHRFPSGELIHPNPSSSPVSPPEPRTPAVKAPTLDTTWLAEFARHHEPSKITGYVAASKAISTIANTANTAQTTQAKVFSSALGRTLMLCGIIVAGGLVTYNLAKHAEADAEKLLVGAVGLGGILWLATKANDSLNESEILAYSSPTEPKLHLPPSPGNDRPQRMLKPVQKTERYN